VCFVAARSMWCSPTRRSFITGRYLVHITGARKRHFLSHLFIKCIILPRQARDKHRENSKKVPFSQEQAATNTNLTPLQFSILSEKLRAANFENHFLGKGHMGWQTTDHLLVNRGFDSHMGYLGGSESYKWGRMDQSLDPNAFTGKHDMVSRSSLPPPARGKNSE
jgi:arylsulfatase A-like enzyme